MVWWYDIDIDIDIDSNNNKYHTYLPIAVYQRS